MDDFIRAVEEILDVEPRSLSGTTVYKDCPQWDSLAALSMMVLIEDRFGAMVDASVMRRAETLSELYGVASRAR